LRNADGGSARNHRLAARDAWRDREFVESVARVDTTVIVTIRSITVMPFTAPGGR
jgi:hypothetical protein